ncbi:hypothetical protein LEMLEM_LOCUS12094, partial [Lemmus lemmus]
MQVQPACHSRTWEQLVISTGAYWSAGSPGWGSLGYTECRHSTLCSLQSCSGRVTA